MKIFKEEGSKERLFEMMQRVNKVKLNEDYNPNMVLDMSFNELVKNNLNIENKNTQATGNKSFVELTCIDNQGNNITFTFQINATEGDQDGVFKINNAQLINFTFDSKDGVESIEMDQNTLKQFNAQKSGQILDVVSEFADVEVEEPAVDEEYMKAINKIDSYPFGGTPRTMQTGNAYADEKPTNPKVRVKAPELEKFVDEELIGEPKPINPSTKSPVDDLPAEKKKIIMTAINNLTVKKGRRQYAPNANEINDEIIRMQNSGECKKYDINLDEDLIGNPNTKAPVNNISNNKTIVIKQAVDNLTTKRGRPNYKPNTREVNDEIKKIKNTFNIKEGTDVSNIDLIKNYYDKSSPEFKKLIIKFAKQEADETLNDMGLDQYSLSEEKYRELIKGIAMRDYKHYLMSMNEEESSYPETIGKDFSVGTKYPIKKKRKKSKKVKLDEDNYEDDDISGIDDLEIPNDINAKKAATIDMEEPSLDDKYITMDENEEPVLDKATGQKLSIGDVVTVEGIEGNFQVGVKQTERKPFLMPFDMNNKTANTHFKIYITTLDNPIFTKVLGFSETDGGFISEDKEKEVNIPDENDEEIEIIDDETPEDNEPEVSNEVPEEPETDEVPEVEDNDEVPEVEDNVEIEDDGTSFEPESDEINQLAQDKEEQGEVIPGGKGEDKSPLEFDPEQILMGLKVEMEHSDDPMYALEIVLDHLSENSEYYTVEDTPEDSAQVNAATDAEDSDDLEMTDRLLGYKPKNVGDEVKGGEEIEDSDDDSEEIETSDDDENVDEPEEVETSDDDENVKTDLIGENIKKNKNLITEQQIKTARLTLSNRNIETGMTKKEAVQILLKNNLKNL